MASFGPCASIARQTYRREKDDCSHGRFDSSVVPLQTLEGVRLVFGVAGALGQGSGRILCSACSDAAQISSPNGRRRRPLLGLDFVGPQEALRHHSHCSFGAARHTPQIPSGHHGHGGCHLPIASRAQDSRWCLLRVGCPV